MALAHREPADGVAGEVHGDERLAERRRSSASVPPCTMPNSAWPGAAGRERRARALRPAQAELHRPLHLAPLGRQFEAFVELHLDVGAEQALDLDGALGGQQGREPSMCDWKRDVLADAADARQAHHLEAAGVGQDRAVPTHEGVQPAEPRDALGARAEHQVIGVAEDDVGAGGLTCSGRAP